MPSDSAVLVVGGRGFVGAATLERLVGSGRRVHCFGPAGPVALPAGAIEISGSIEDAEALRRALTAVRPAAVVNFAAFASGPVGLARSAEADPERALAINVLGFRRLLDACVSSGVSRLVWMSSTVVLGPADTLDSRLDESAPRRPANTYALTKSLAEEIADYVRRRHGLSITGLRIPLMLGPRLWYEGAATPIKRLIAATISGEAAEIGAPSMRFDAMHVADLADLVAAIIDCRGDLQAIYNVAGFTTSYAGIASLLAELAPGVQARLVEENPPIVYPLVSQARLEADLDWRPRRDLRAILQDMLDEGRGAA